MSCSGCRRWAAVRPAMPAPTMATLWRTPDYSGPGPRHESVQLRGEPGAEQRRAARQGDRAEPPAARKPGCRAGRVEVREVGADAREDPSAVTGEGSGADDDIARAESAGQDARRLPAVPEP